MTVPDRDVVDWSLTADERDLLWELAMRSYREDFHHDDGVLRSPTPQAQRDWDLLISVIHKLPMQETQPPALVAISPDRQWLVAPDAVRRRLVIFVLEDDDYGGNYLRISSVEDTGQGADEVLAAYLEGREG